MPEQQQATNEQVSLEQYKQLQAEFTRKSQQLAEVERLRSEGQLVEKSAYDDHLIKWASEHPEQALEVFPSLREHLASQGTQGATGSKVLPGSIGSTGAVDDAIFDTQSEAYQKFVQEYGQKGYQRALLARMAPELLDVTGLNKELGELREFKQNYEGQLEDLHKRVEKAERYAISSYDQWQLAQDPRRQQIRDLQQKLKESKGDAWYEIVENLNKLKELESQQAAPPPPAAAAAQAQPPSAPAPEQLAGRIDQASVVPQGAGSGSGPLPSQAIDPFDAAIAKVDPQVARNVGIPSAA